MASRTTATIRSVVTTAAVAMCGARRVTVGSGLADGGGAGAGIDPLAAGGAVGAGDCAPNRNGHRERRRSHRGQRFLDVVWQDRRDVARLPGEPILERDAEFLRRLKAIAGGFCQSANQNGDQPLRQVGAKLVGRRRRVVQLRVNHRDRRVALKRQTLRQQPVSTTAMAYRSMRGSTSSPRICSGAMYAGVPTINP